MCFKYERHDWCGVQVSIKINLMTETSGFSWKNRKVKILWS